MSPARPRGVPPPDPTPRQMATLRLYVETGSVRETARRMGVHEQTVKRNLAALRERTGDRNNVQLAVRFADQVRPAA